MDARLTWAKMAKKALEEDKRRDFATLQCSRGIAEASRRQGAIRVAESYMFRVNSC